MTEEKSKEVCKRCKFRDLRVNKENRNAEHFCIQANCFICYLTKCPLR